MSGIFDKLKAMTNRTVDTYDLTCASLVWTVCSTLPSVTVPVTVVDMMNMLVIAKRPTTTISTSSVAGDRRHNHCLKFCESRMKTHKI